MIREKRILRKLGYLKDQQGIVNRYLREQGGWDKHLLRCREYILNSTKLHNPERVTILGSGWLLDVPLEELAATGAQINLVDIYHPSQIRRKVSRFSNVNLISDDITGGLLKKIWEARISDQISISSMEIPIYNPGYDPGLVVSLNLLTQLDMLLVESLSGQSSLSKDDLRNFRRRVQERHIEFLQSRDSIIISDIKENIYKENDLLSGSDLLFTTFPDGDRAEEWLWEFDTTGLYYSGKKVVFNVKAIELNKK
jgi:hypothetical protein